MDSQLYEEFLEALRELDEFSVAYSARRQRAFERDSPDSRRLIEALAFFAARTKVASVRRIAASRRRLVREFFPYVLGPVPAMTMVDFTPRRQLADVATIASETEIAVQAPTAPQPAVFRTTKSVDVLPVQLQRLERQPLPNGTRLILRFEAAFPRSEDLGELSLHIHYLEDYLQSMRVVRSLRRHLRRASVHFGDKLDADANLVSCDFDFGIDEGWGSYLHPIDKVRWRFQLPQMDNYLRIKAPSSPRNWTTFLVCLDIDEGWPRHFHLSAGVFRPFVSPAANLTSSFAEPIEFDGTTDYCPLRHPRPALGYQLHSLQGVYEATDGAMHPLLETGIGQGSGTFQLEEDPRADVARYGLNIDLPGAFEEARVVSAEALWYQPWVSEVLRDVLDVSLYRSGSPIACSTLGEPVPHFAPAQLSVTDDELHLFVLQNKPYLNQTDLDALLASLGTAWRGPFGVLRSQLARVVVEEIPRAAGGASGSKLVYRLLFRLEEDTEDLALEFARYVEFLLDAWIADKQVQVRAESA